MSSGSVPHSQSRLEEIPSRSIEPFVRATGITDASVYWMPVWEFPMLPGEAAWLREFHRRLAAHLAKSASLRQECFLQFKSLYPDLIDRFTGNAERFLPMTGIGLIPGAPRQPLPQFEDIKQQVEEAGKSGKPVDTKQWMPDHLHWFLNKDAEAQRDSFFGNGGMLTLYLPEDPKTKPPQLDLPRVVTTHPAYSPSMMDEIQAMYSLQDSFLKRSKEAFGEPLLEDPSYRGLMFVLPLLSGRSVVDATTEQRARWFEIFTAYFAESKTDKGMLLLLKEPEFDEQLADILRSMEEDDFVYRS